MAFKLDRLSAYTFIVQASRAPTSAFIALWEKMCGKIENQESSQDELIAEQAALGAAQAAQQAQIVSILTSLGYIIADINTAQQAANEAQSTADSAGGGAVVSGSATDPAITVSSTVTWTAGPIVNLAGVVAGNLTITGTGPQQDSNVTLTIINITQVAFVGQYRVVEVIAGVDGSVFGPFAMSVGLTGPDPETPGTYPAVVYNEDSAAVAAVLSARGSTGAVSYRLDFRKTGGPTVNSLQGYVYARRA